MNLTRFVQRELDIVLLITVLLLASLGITMIYSATFDWEAGSAGTVYQKQILWLCIALVGLGLTLSIPLKYFYAFAYILYGLAMVLLLLVLEFGDRRWFNLGPIHVQQPFRVTQRL